MRRRFGWDFRAGKQAQQLKTLDAIRAVMTSDGRTLAQAAIGWIWAYSKHAIPIPGFKTALLSNSWGMDYPREGWEQLFDVTVREPIAQVPPHSHCDHLRREPKPSEA